MGKQKWRLAITLALIVVGIIASWKTIRLWSMSQAEREAMMANDPDGYKSLVDGAMRLGLDLQGGIHTVVRVKLEEIKEAERDGAVERVKEIIRNRVDPEGVSEPVIQTQGNDRIVIDLPGWKDEKRAEELITKVALLEFKMLEDWQTATAILERIDSVAAMVNARESGDDTANPSTGEESVSPDNGDSSSGDQSADELLAELTADSATGDSAESEEMDLVSELLGADSATGDTLSDEFAVDEDKPFTGTLLHAQYNEKTGNWPGLTFPANQEKRLKRILSLPEVKRVIPRGVQFAWSTRTSVENNQEVIKLYILKDEVRFLGKNLENIRVSNDQFGRPAVDFNLSGRAASQFASLTGNNIGKPFAIVLDGKVESAPFINSRIRNSGQITMGGGSNNEDIREEARILATVLKAGSLPAPIELIEKNFVGPTLGSDSIAKGLTSSLVGLVLVLLFITFYYRISGVIANLALLFNLFFLLAFMAGLSATLTMPGIAGIILTIGIAVDANILIFERIREELAAGKSVRAAIDSGYDRALLAIIDSHVTTMITAAALYWFGSGPIRGFAVTLFWGVLLSLFTAVIITKTVFDFRKQYKSLSI